MTHDAFDLILFTRMALLAAILNVGGSAAAEPAQAVVDFDTLWKQLQSLFPEAAKYRPLEEIHAPLHDLLRWARPDAEPYPVVDTRPDHRS